MFLFSVMPAQLSWQLFCVCTSPYSWVGTLSACLGMKHANVLVSSASWYIQLNSWKKPFSASAPSLYRGSTNPVVQWKWGAVAPQANQCSMCKAAGWVSDLGLELEALQVGTVVAFCPFFRCRRICLWCKARSRAAVLCKEDCHRKIGMQ